MKINPGIPLDSWLFSFISRAATLTSKASFISRGSNAHIQGIANRMSPVE
jgi:hypothetical protein